MRRVLILDDDEGRVRAFKERLSRTGFYVVWVDNAWECMQLLDSYHWDHVFLDHDLGLSYYHRGVMDPGSGSEVVRFIADRALGQGRYRNTKFWIHSMNEEGAPQYMAYVLRGAGLEVVDAPQAWDRITIENAVRP